jgi:hypothetical protein
MLQLELRFPKKSRSRFAEHYCAKIMKMFEKVAGGPTSA